MFWFGVFLPLHLYRCEGVEGFTLCGNKITTPLSQFIAFKDTQLWAVQPCRYIHGHFSPFSSKIDMSVSQTTQAASFLLREARVWFTFSSDCSGSPPSEQLLLRFRKKGFSLLQAHRLALRGGEGSWVSLPRLQPLAGDSSLSLAEPPGDGRSRISQHREHRFVALCMVSQGNTVQ